MTNLLFNLKTLKFRPRSLIISRNSLKNNIFQRKLKMSADCKEALGLTEHHQNQIRELLRYNRFKRSERLVGIELCFKDFIETRLYDDETYTQDEVYLPIHR